MKSNRLNPALWRTLLALLLLVTASCEHKELCTYHFHNTVIQVVFDWRNAPDAAPESMRLYLYPSDGSKPFVYEFSDYRGGRIEVPAGRYRVICVNSDTESILYRNIDSYDTFEAYASDGTLTVGSAAVQPEENERVVQSLDLLYTARLSPFTIEALEDGQTLTLCPELSMNRHRITITGVSNLKYISSGNLACTVAGVPGGLLVGKGETTAETVTVAFGLTSDGESTLTADFVCFSETKRRDSTPDDGEDENENEDEDEDDGDDGVTPPAAIHKMRVYVATTDGIKDYVFNVPLSTSSGGNSGSDDDSGSSSIEVDSLPLPKPIVNGGGFHPDVDGWQNIDVDVSM